MGCVSTRQNQSRISDQRRVTGSRLEAGARPEDKENVSGIQEIKLHGNSGIKGQAGQSGAYAGSGENNMGNGELSPTKLTPKRQSIIEKYSINVKDDSRKVLSVNSYNYQTLLHHNPSIPVQAI